MQLIAGIGGHLYGKNSTQSSEHEVFRQHWTGGGQWAPVTGQLWTGYGAHRDFSASGGALLSLSGRGHFEH